MNMKDAMEKAIANLTPEQIRKMQESMKRSIKIVDSAIEQIERKKGDGDVSSS
jgi:predicted P-loop ATPase/GTPase